MKKNETKRNTSKRNLLLVALLLLVAVFTFGGYTLSKYVSSVSKEGTVNVAKWGFELNAEVKNLFGEEYKYDTDKTYATIDGEGNVVVKAESGREVLAPGTGGEMTFGIKGKAEVLAQISFSFGGSKDVKLVASKGDNTYEYLPVVYTLSWGTSENNYGTGKETFYQISSVESKVTELLKGSSDNNLYVEAGKEVNLQFKLEWKWDFERGTASSINEGTLKATAGSLPGNDNDVKNLVNELDTVLGLISNGKTTPVNGYNVTESVVNLTFDFTLGVTQVANK